MVKGWIVIGKYSHPMPYTLDRIKLRSRDVYRFVRDFIDTHKFRRKHLRSPCYVHVESFRKEEKTFSFPLTEELVLKLYAQVKQPLQNIKNRR